MVGVYCVVMRLNIFANLFKNVSAVGYEINNIGCHLKIKNQ